MDDDDTAQEQPETELDRAADDEAARLWVVSISALLGSRPGKPDRSAAVNRALDRFFTVALDRATRILRSDMTD